MNVSGGTLSDFTQVNGNSYTAIFRRRCCGNHSARCPWQADSYSDAAGNNGGAVADTVTIDTLNPTLALDIVNASLNDGTNSSLVTFAFQRRCRRF
ncbi:MAG UNVERIFIED_CONTAM: Ig-like domain-containing protein [Microcystis novacekii LVE1205-3]